MRTFERRLRLLEQKLKIDAITVKLDDGRTFIVRSYQVFDLMLDAFRRAHARINGQPDPESRYAHELDVLEHAIESDEKDGCLLQCAIDALQNHPADSTAENVTVN